jgi:hypothetical protein
MVFSFGPHRVETPSFVIFDSLVAFVKGRNPRGRAQADSKPFTNVQRKARAQRSERTGESWCI